MFVIAKSMNNYVFSKSNCGGKTPSIQSVLITPVQPGETVHPGYSFVLLRQNNFQNSSFSPTRQINMSIGARSCSEIQKKKKKWTKKLLLTKTYKCYKISKFLLKNDLYKSLF